MSAYATIELIDIDLLHRRADVRPINDKVVESLAESIDKAGGLFHPLRVRLIGDVYEVIAGSHRLRACDSLGWNSVPCIVVEDDDMHAEMAMIDENLLRSELSPVEYAKQTARRKFLYEALHPETKREATLKQGDAFPSRQVGDTEKVDRFTANTARVSGRSERTIQRDAERGEKVSDEAAKLLAGTKLDTGSYLDRLKKVDVNRHAILTP